MSGQKGGLFGLDAGHLQEGRLVAFDLQEVVPAFVHDGAGGVLLAVERVGRDGFSFQRRQRAQEFLGDFHLAARGAFLLVHDRHGHWGAILDVHETDGADDVADHFAIEGESAG